MSGFVKQTDNDLPNPSQTWARDLPAFESWKENKPYVFDSEEAALLTYLLESMRSVALVVAGETLFDVANEVADRSTLYQSYRGELLYAFLALAIAGDSDLARRFVAGQRLCSGLHPDYVKRTRCYG